MCCAFPSPAFATLDTLSPEGEREKVAHYFARTAATACLSAS